MNNLGLKIIAVLAAIVLWLIVVNINDPVITTKYEGIQVTLLNSDAITDDGKTYEILDHTDSVDVTITAKKSVIAALSKANIRASADMSQLTFMNTVGIEVTTDKLFDEIDNIKLSTVNLKLNIEDVAKKQMFISVTTSGAPSDGYIIGSVTADKNVVQIKGPKSVIESIASATAVADISGMKSDIGTSADIKLYDAKGKQIKHPALEMNFKSVNVSVEIIGTKQVPVKYNIMGEPADGYSLTGEVDYKVQTVKVAGKTQALRQIKEIVIPETAINVTGQSSNMTVRVDVLKYLPEGIILAEDNFDGKATVVVYIEKEEKVTTFIDDKSISITNIPSGLDVEVVDMNTPVYVTLIGLKKDIEDVDADSLTGSVNVQSLMKELGITTLTPGTFYTAPVKLNIPNGVRADKEIKVQIFVAQKEFL